MVGQDFLDRRQAKNLAGTVLEGSFLFLVEGIELAALLLPEVVEGFLEGIGLLVLEHLLDVGVGGQAQRLSLE